MDNIFYKIGAKHFVRFNFLTITFGLLIFSFQAYPQQFLLKKDNSIVEKLTYQPNADSFLVKRRLLRASGEVMLVQVIPWSVSYFITKEDFAKISFKTFGHNLKLKSWAWDGDQFFTNEFAHPSQGNLYFNSFRSNGYGFLGSASATFGGSLIWEIFGESQAPSPNDLINTTFGGVILGEMIHRLSNKILYSRKSSLRRRTNEVAAFLINPMNGFNRAIDGKWKRSYQENHPFDSSKIDAQFNLGIRRIDIESHNTLSKGHAVLFGRMEFLYSDGNESLKKPFDEFKVDMEMGVDNQIINNLSIYGLLYGRELRANDRVKHLAVLSANYDLYNNSAFFYGGQSLNMNLISEFKIASKSKINTSIGAGPIILAAIPDQYLHIEQRNYDYGSGLSLTANGLIDIAERAKLGLNYVGGFVYTISGNHSHYSLHVLSVDLGLNLFKAFSVNLNSGYYTIKGNYRDFPDVNKYYPVGRFSFGYHVTF